MRPISDVRRMLLDILTSGEQTMSSVHEEACERGFVVQRKTVCSHIYQLHKEGKVVQVGNCRPSIWRLADAPPPVVVELPIDLQLLMGINPFGQPKGHVVSPLTCFELGHYGKQPVRKSKYDINMQSGLRGTVYQD